MLPRIASALEELVSPVSTRISSVASAQKSHDFKRESFPHLDRKPAGKNPEGQQQGHSDPDSPSSNVIPFPTLELKPNTSPRIDQIPEVIRNDSEGDLLKNQSPKSPQITDQKIPCPIPQGVAQTLLEILNLFHEQKNTLMRWLGSRSYAKASQVQKKGSRVRNGSMLDHKVE